MKHLKKLFTILFAVTMLFGTGINVFAGDSGNDKTITIKDNRTGRLYIAYQIVRGEISGGVLSNIKWGDGQTNHTAGNLLTEDELTQLPGSSATREQIKAYIDTLTLSNTYSSSVSENGNYVIKNLYPGWYLIKETTNTSNKDDFTSAFMVKVVGNAEANPKGSKTTLTKKVDDVNDSNTSDTTSNSVEKDSADYDIGDEITYTLTATLGADLTDYTSYKLSFVDNLSIGLTYKELVSVTVKHGSENRTISTNNVAVADGSAYASSAAYSEGTIKTFTITNVLDSPFNARAGDIIVIKYKATLNQDAVIGSQGNPNKVYLEYSNNPEVNTEVGRTPEDINIVFTYKAVFEKFVTEETVKKHLSGAEFTLYKVNSTITDTQVKNIAGTEDFVKKVYTATKSAGKYENESSEVPDSVFTFNGLDDGTYVLKETKTPDGYNSIDPIKFVVSATHDLDNENPTLTELTGNKTSGIVDITGTPKTNGTNTITSEIENKKGNTLPSTGGIGTTLFYVIGGVLVAGAAVILIAKNRVSKE